MLNELFGKRRCALRAAARSVSNFRGVGLSVIAIGRAGLCGRERAVLLGRGLLRATSVKGGAGRRLSFSAKVWSICEYIEQVFFLLRPLRPRRRGTFASSIIKSLLISFF